MCNYRIIPTIRRVFFFRPEAAAQKSRDLINQAWAAFPSDRSATRHSLSKQ